MAVYSGEPGVASFIGVRIMEVVVTGAIRCAKLQSSCHHQQLVYTSASVSHNVCVCLLVMQPLVLDQEFHVLGQQNLTELRDKIICVSDHIAVGEFSENPNQQPDILTKVNNVH